MDKTRAQHMIASYNARHEPAERACPSCGQIAPLAYIPWTGVDSVPGGHVCRDCAGIQRPR